MKKVVLIVAILFSVSTVFVACRETKKDAETKVEETGEVIKETAGDAQDKIEEVTEKTEKAIEEVKEKVEEIKDSISGN